MKTNAKEQKSIMVSPIPTCFYLDQKMIESPFSRLLIERQPDFDNSLQASPAGLDILNQEGPYV